MRLPNNPGPSLPISAFGARLAASLALVGVAAGIAGLGTYAGFTSATSAQPQNVSSGTLVVDVGATGSVSNRLDVDAADIAPGDTIERTVDLINSGSLDFASLDLTTSAPVTSSLLDTDTSHGLQMTIDSCSVPWTETAVGAGYTYSCSDPGGPTSVLASSPVIQSGVALSSMNAATAGGTDHLRVTLTLPTNADDSFQNQSSTIDYVFSGAARAGKSK
jgi:hypothetical protein